MDDMDDKHDWQPETGMQSIITRHKIEINLENWQHLYMAIDIYINIILVLCLALGVTLNACRSSLNESMPVQ